MPFWERAEEGYCRARLRTMARPMPLFAPVTRAVRDVGGAIFSKSWGGEDCCTDVGIAAWLWTEMVSWCVIQPESHDVDDEE